MKSHRALLLALASLVATATPGVRCLSQVSVLGNSVQERKAAAGSEYPGSILIRNDGTVAQRVRIYTTDYRFTAEGISEFGEPGTTPRSNARWITFGLQTVVIAPGQSSTITYRVNVPQLPLQSATGSYWSVAMIEGQPAMGPRHVGAGTVRIQTIVRQAVQLVTHVGSTGAASVALYNVKLVSGENTSEIQFDAGNDGVRARKLSLSVDLYADDGSFVGRYSSQRGLVYPGSSIRQQFSLGALRKGNYLAFIVADAGDDDLFVGNFKLKL